MLNNIPKDKKLSTAIFIVLALIVVINTVVMIFVGFKLLDMEEVQSEISEQSQESIEDLSKARDLNLLKKEFNELEKSVNQNDSSTISDTEMNKQ